VSLTFADAWLRAREPVDHAARSAVVTEAAARHLGGRTSPLVVDLGCGRGSNLRFLARRLPHSTRWRLVDRDADLLASISGEAGGGVETVEADLRTRDLRALLAGADLVTAAALLDLVGQEWLERLVAATRAVGAALLVTGNVDGRIAWTPAHPLDAAMTAAFLAHHGGDKGFGAALGSRAPATLLELLGEGWRLVHGRGDWQLDDGARELQRAYLEGAVLAIRETAADGDDIDRWARAREGAIVRGESRLLVGHIDIFAAAP
jgi:SAM-dependent methyltransferase